MAKHGSISKAANELFVTQPAVTAQIKKLENELGVDLFLRDAGVMRLTPAGREAEELFARYLEEAATLSRKLAELSPSRKQVLSVGFHGPIGWAGVPELIGSFAKLHSDAEFEVIEDTWDTLLRLVNEHRIDAAFVVATEFDKRGGMERCDLFREGLCVALPISHSLVRQEKVTVDDLEGEVFAVVNPQLMPSYLKQCARQMAKDGLKPRKGDMGNSYVATLTLVAGGRGIAFVPRSFKAASSSIAYRDLAEDNVEVQVSLVWRKANNNPLLTSFVDFCNSWNWENAAAGV